MKLYKPMIVLSSIPISPISSIKLRGGELVGLHTKLYNGISGIDTRIVSNCTSDIEYLKMYYYW